MKKPFVQIVLDEDQDYGYEAGNDISLWILSAFLTTDVGCNWIDCFKEFAYSWESETSSNLTFVYKKGDEIILADIYSEEEDKGPFLHMHKDEYIRILDQWKEFCRTKPKEILITKEDNKIVMAPKYE